MNTFSERGFTLVETLVSITILLIIVTGPLTISMTSAKSTSFASEQVVAFFLAQEGAEIAQKARDEYWLADVVNAETKWNEFADDSVGADFRRCFEGSGCGLELATDAGGTLKPIISCMGTSCQLRFNSLGERARYTYNAVVGEESLYTRKIFFTKVSASDVKVVSEVTWRTGTRREVQKVEVETHLLNVYAN